MRSHIERNLNFLLLTHVVRAVGDAENYAKAIGDYELEIFVKATDRGITEKEFKKAYKAFRDLKLDGFPSDAYDDERVKNILITAGLAYRVSIGDHYILMLTKAGERLEPADLGQLCLDVEPPSGAESGPTRFD